MKYPVINSKGKLIKRRRRFTRDDIKKAWVAVQKANYIIGEIVVR